MFLDDDDDDDDDEDWESCSHSKTLSPRSYNPGFPLTWKTWKTPGILLTWKTPEVVYLFMEFLS